MRSWDNIKYCDACGKRLRKNQKVLNLEFATVLRNSKICFGFRKRPTLWFHLKCVKDKTIGEILLLEKLKE